MIEKLVQDLIESIADTIVATTVAMAEDHQQRRDKVDAYRSAVHSSATSLLTAIGESVREATRNRYLEWIEHPRLGHEPLSAEVQASDVGLHEAVLAMKLSPTALNRIQLTGACIRVAAVTEAIGPECIYLPSIKRAAPVKAVRRKKPVKAGSDKRLSRRKPCLGDVPEALWPIIAELGTNNSDRWTALAKLEEHRGGDHDRDGIITKLATLAALAEHGAFVDDLAVAAKLALGLEAETIPSQDHVASPEAAIVVDITTTVFSSSKQTKPVAAIRPTDDLIAGKIATVADWCRDHDWAVTQKGAGFGLKKLGQRGDLNVIFDEVAAHPAMQRVLGEIHAAKTG